MQLKPPVWTQSSAHSATQTLVSPQNSFIHGFSMAAGCKVWICFLRRPRRPHPLKEILYVKDETGRTSEWTGWAPNHSTTSWLSGQSLHLSGPRHLICKMSWWWLPHPPTSQGCRPGELSHKCEQKRELVIFRLVSKKGMLGCSSGELKGPRLQVYPSFLSTSHLEIVLKTPNSFNSHVNNNCSYWVLPLTQFTHIL